MLMSFRYLNRDDSYANISNIIHKFGCCSSYGCFLLFVRWRLRRIMLRCGLYIKFYAILPVACGSGPYNCLHINPGILFFAMV